MTKPLKIALLGFMLGSSMTHAVAQRQKLYLANDDHTDYMWTADEATYRRSFLKMLDFYADHNDRTAHLPTA